MNGQAQHRGSREEFDTRSIIEVAPLQTVGFTGRE
jgi:hypothetical protein